MLNTRTIILILLYVVLLTYLGLIIWIAPLALSVPIHLISIVILLIITISNYILRRIAVALLCLSILFTMTVSLVKTLLF